VAVYQKPLHIDRVRVLDAAGCMHRTIEQRRWSTCVGAGTRGAWRQPAKESSEDGTGCSMPEAEDEEPGAAKGSTEARPDVVWTTSAQPQESPAGGDDSDAGLDPADAISAAAPTPAADDDERGPREIALIGAVTRAVDEARRLRCVVDLVRETCSGEERRETGPWEFSLSLEPQGFEDATLDIRLSRQSLALRFSCASRATLDLLSRHTSTLQAQLDEQIKPPLAVEIAVCEALRSN